MAAKFASVAMNIQADTNTFLAYLVQLVSQQCPKCHTHRPCKSGSQTQKPCGMTLSTQNTKQGPERLCSASMVLEISSMTT